MKSTICILLILAVSVSVYAGQGYIAYEYNLAGAVVCQKAVNVDDVGVETVIQETRYRYNGRGERIVERLIADPNSDPEATSDPNDLNDRIKLFSYDHRGGLAETVTKADGNGQIYTNASENRVEYEASDRIEQSWYGLTGRLEYTVKFDAIEICVQFPMPTCYVPMPFADVDTMLRYTKDHRDIHITGYNYLDGQLESKDILVGFDEDDPYFDDYQYPLAGLLWKTTAAFEYDTAGRRTQTTNAADHFTTLEYNSQNQPIANTLWQGQSVLRVNDDPDPNFVPQAIQRALTAYDGLGRKVRTAVLYDPNENINIGGIDFTQDKITDFVYDTDGKLYRKKELIEKAGASGIFALTETSYDGLGRVDEVLYGQLNEAYWAGEVFDETTTTLKIIGTHYNALGQKDIQTITDTRTDDYTAVDANSYYTYTDQGQLETVSNETGRLLKNEYDALGRVHKQINAVGRITLSHYDALGNLETTVEDANGVERTTVFGYDRNGRKMSITAGSESTEYTYNYLSQIDSIDYPAADDIEFGHDMRGFVTSRTRNGVTTQYKRDAMGRVSYKQYSNDPNWADPNNALPFDEFLYDAAGRKHIIAYMADGNDLEFNIYSYNGFGNLIGASETCGGFSKSVSYGYDQRGQFTSMTYPDEKIVSYTRDALGRIDSVAYDGKLLVDYYYQGNTVISKEMANADIEYTAAVDSLGRITGETFSDISTSSSFKTNSYDYTAHTNRLDERNTIDYGFDTLGHVTSEDTTDYDCDILGNPTNASDDGLSYTLDNEDRIVDVNDVSGDVAAYEYDRLGRRASKIVDGNEIHFVYDLSGNVIAEYGQDQQDTTWEKDYVYGAQGEAVYMRIPQTTEMNSALENFISFISAWLCDPYCDANDLLWDYDDSNDINLIDWAAAVDANDFFGAFTTNGRYILTDFRNSVVGKVNLDGSIDEISYNAFGEPITAQGTDLEGLSVLWNGYYFDNETANYYLRNRYYSPLERRFITEDPHGINPDGNWNNYFAPRWQYIDGYSLQVYAKGDPVNGWDGWGLENCGIYVACGKLINYPTLNRLGIRHCEIRNGKTPSDREDEVFHRTWKVRPKNRKLMAGSAKGKSCKCATCGEVSDCVLKAYHEWMTSSNYAPIGNNCHTGVAISLSKCCLKTNWKPSWHAGKDPLCTKWAKVLTGYINGMPIYHQVCVERLPSI